MKGTLLTLLLAGLAAATALANPAKPDPRAALVKKFPGSKLEEFKPAQIPGLFEFTRGADVLYVTADGRYAIDGDLYDLSSDANLSDQRRREARLALLAAVPESQMVTFGPAKAAHTVTVFTDLDCGYCRKLHSEIAEYNEFGIRVRYLFFPREGPDSESWDKAVSVWCASNRNDALTRAKKGETIKAAKCNPNPVQRDYELGQNVGLRGTPAIVLPNGDMLPGYVPPAMLAQRLAPAAKASSAAK
jgi:thiol:disulfide interchange protein DsbC